MESFTVEQIIDDHVPEPQVKILKKVLFGRELEWVIFCLSNQAKPQIKFGDFYYRISLMHVFLESLSRSPKEINELSLNDQNPYW